VVFDLKRTQVVVAAVALLLLKTLTPTDPALA
jgi:hypothetical protein